MESHKEKLPTPPPLRSLENISSGTNPTSEATLPTTDTKEAAPGRMGTNAPAPTSKMGTSTPADRMGANTQADRTITNTPAPTGRMDTNAPAPDKMDTRAAASTGKMGTRGPTPNSMAGTSAPARTGMSTKTPESTDTLDSKAPSYRKRTNADVFAHPNYGPLPRLPPALAAQQASFPWTTFFQPIDPAPEANFFTSPASSLTLIHPAFHHAANLNSLVKSALAPASASDQIKNTSMDARAKDEHIRNNPQPRLSAFNSQQLQSYALTETTSSSTSTVEQPSNPVATFKRPSNPVATFKRPSNPVATFKQPSTPVATVKQPSNPVAMTTQPSTCIAMIEQLSTSVAATTKVTECDTLRTSVPSATYTSVRHQSPPTSTSIHATATNFLGLPPDPSSTLASCSVSTVSAERVADVISTSTTSVSRTYGPPLSAISPPTPSTLLHPSTQPDNAYILNDPRAPYFEGRRPELLNHQELVQLCYKLHEQLTSLNSRFLPRLGVQNYLPPSQVPHIPFLPFWQPHPHHQNFSLPSPDFFADPNFKYYFSLAQLESEVSSQSPFSVPSKAKRGRKSRQK